MEENSEKETAECILNFYEFDGFEFCHQCLYPCDFAYLMSGRIKDTKQILLYLLCEWHGLNTF